MRGPVLDHGVAVSFVAVAAAGIAGCGQILGVADYKTAAPTPADAAPASLPSLPARPDSTRIDCERCVADKCGAERSLCENSPRCRAMLACQGQCKDPKCIADCTDKLPRSLDFADYFDCAFGVVSAINANPAQCSTECGVGSNWECVGNYTWTSLPGSHEVTEQVQVELMGTGALGAPLMLLQGVEVAACDDFGAALEAGAKCGDWKSVNAYGQVAVSFVPKPFFSPTVFSIRGGAGELQRVYPRPIARSGPLELDVFSLKLGTYLNGVALAGGDFDPSLGVLIFYSVDCLGVLATTHPDLPFEATKRLAYLVPPPPPLPAPGPEEGAAGVFYNVQPSGAVAVTASVNIDGAIKQVANRTVMVAPRSMTTVYLYPSN
jgi:hypothetical protein